MSKTIEQEAKELEEMSEILKALPGMNEAICDGIAMWLFRHGYRKEIPGLTAHIVKGSTVVEAGEGVWPQRKELYGKNLESYESEVYRRGANDMHDAFTTILKQKGLL